MKLRYHVDYDDVGEKDEPIRVMLAQGFLFDTFWRLQNKVKWTNVHLSSFQSFIIIIIIIIIYF